MAAFERVVYGFKPSKKVLERSEAVSVKSTITREKRLVFEGQAFML
jgi:hypothetical protein